MEERATIKNRGGLQIVTVTDVAADARGLVFIAHGLHGTKDQAHIMVIARAFSQKGYTVVRWDATHSTGESEGAMEDATPTGYFHDFEDVVAWASEQPWYREPFVVAGHSLGALCSILYTQKNPDKVIALAPLGAVVSGALMKAQWEEDIPNELREWQRAGIREWTSTSRPGIVKRLKWSFMEDVMQYDVLRDVSALHKPILMVVGSEDDSTPVVHQQKFFDAVPALSKEIHIVPGAQHTFVDPEHLVALQSILASWIDTLPA